METICGNCSGFAVPSGNRFHEVFKSSSKVEGKPEYKNDQYRATAKVSAQEVIIYYEIESGGTKQVVEITYSKKK